MSLYYEDECVALHHGDCADVMRTLPDNSVDSIVTDPPYGLGFMGKSWDALPPGLEWAEECLRVLKPGGHLLAFGGTRTWHRLAVAVEDAGFEIRDSLAWLYGSGFPKSMNVAKAIESGGGRPEDIRRLAMGDDYTPSGRGRVNYDHGGGSAMNGSTAEVPPSETAQQWEGWGTALKPAFEPVVMGRKPLVGTVAANVLEHGTGSINIDASRIGTTEALGRTNHVTSKFIDNANGTRDTHPRTVTLDNSHGLGRHPANVLLDDYTAEVLDEQSGTLTSGKMKAGTTRASKTGWAGPMPATTGAETIGDSGGASRFFYVAKAPKSERPVVNGIAHETVKPLAIMRYLVKMVTPPGGTVLEPFAGSGTTVEACILEGFNCIAIEREETYLPLIEARIERQQRSTKEDEPMLDIFEGVA